MKSLKVLLLAATMASAHAAFAQEDAVTKQSTTNQVVKKEYTTPEEHAAKQTEKLTATCGLSKDQQLKVNQIFLESDKAIEASNKAAGKDKAKAEADKTKLVQERRKKIDAVLTPDQKVKFDAATKANSSKPNEGNEK